MGLSWTANSMRIDFHTDLVMSKMSDALLKVTPGSHFGSKVIAKGENMTYF